MTTEESSQTPNPPSVPAKTPGIVIAALVLSIFGLTGITAIAGVILGFIGRRKAKQAGKGVGMATAAIAIGAAWLVLLAFGALLPDSSETSNETAIQEVVEEALKDLEADVDEALEDLEAEVDEQSELTLGSLGVTIDELPAKWNEAVEAFGAGFLLPQTITTSSNKDILNMKADTFFLEFEAADPSVGNGSVSITWMRETRNVGEISIDGLFNSEQFATALASTSGAATYATTNLPLADAETFFVEELLGAAFNKASGATDIVENSIEETDRSYQYFQIENIMSFSITTPMSAVE
ncbi:MAG: DUF4190 domain-containing protein [Candidatus Nanopelagicales bacterium]|nr:DUF4190 domain-containing protein [Candidatus Nanopelagicales bacterium]